MGAECQSISALCVLPAWERAGLPDAGRALAGLPDAGPVRAGLPDAGRPLVGLPDAVLARAGLPDAARGWVGIPDAALAWVGLPDAPAALDAERQLRDALPVWPVEQAAPLPEPGDFPEHFHERRDELRMQPDELPAGSGAQFREHSDARPERACLLWAGMQRQPPRREVERQARDKQSPEDGQVQELPEPHGPRLRIDRDSWQPAERAEPARQRGLRGGSGRQPAPGEWDER